MKFLICFAVLMGAGALAEERVKRQSSYTFPGPRSDRSYRAQVHQAAPAAYAPEEPDEEVIRRQYTPQAPPQYAPQAPPQRAAAPPPQSYEPPSAPRPQARSQSGRRRAVAATTSRANKYGSAPQQSLNGAEEDEEEEQGPDPLTLLLEDSQFTCGGKNDGYYADDSVNCQVFHYCVGGAKHSWMCPENTVFHQVHLNCVPDAQDICSQSQKFHFVNDYLYKPVDYEGPNKTARYSQRYYPDGYVVGDPIVAPHEHARRPASPPQPQPQSYPAAPPRQSPRQLADTPSRPSHRAPPPQEPAYRAPSEEPTYRPEPRPQPRPVERRPSRPVETFPQAENPETYRSAAPSPPQPSYRVAAQPQLPPQSYRPVQESPQQPPQTYRAVQESPQSYRAVQETPQTYRVVPPQQTAPQPQTYRVVTPQQVQPQTYRVAQPQPQTPPHRPGYTSSEEVLYQPQVQSRRPNPPARQSAAGYSPPRQQYRPQASARSYQPYASNAAGVEYDEEY